MLLVLSYFVLLLRRVKQGLIREGEHFFHLSPSSSSSPFRLLIHPPTANDIYIYIPSFERAFLTVKIKNGRDIIEAFVTVLSSDKFFPIGPIDRIRHPKVTNYTVNFPYISVQAVHSKREGDAFGDPFRRWRWYVRNCTPDPWQKRQRRVRQVP